MALAIGDEVALARTAGQTLTANANFQFGRINSGSDPWEVVWANGSLAAGVIGTLLDKVVGENATLPAVYSFDDGFNSATPSNGYNGIVVRAYSRQNAGAGSAVDYVLLKSLQNDELYEVPKAALVVQAGQ